ncbi:hypothetical protein BDK51DRAFT_25038 [Blyttiomyces helicus]|uniref:Peptide hydrolase n=1 Tax=Blyttiomyces helicus TaxID=388810 RepID=A0A4P9W702_9FUNG|nr:hypothetical protein BDK51DRAFT_25038 [Blyttiomyces helicus]|eukprot:RKO88239.1 hypothetical protein BDK51DRAFT_25038 [Blyttiomyces helicus]
MPTSVKPADVATKVAFSGAAAWDHLKVISAEPHRFNSDENLKVRQYLIDRLIDLKELAEMNGRPGFIEDPVDMLGLRKQLSYFESSNVLVRLRGNNGNSSNRNALLVSSHFDSTTVSHGVDDAGIGIVVMLESIRSLIYAPLEHDVIFNFNNAEEPGLYGGWSFISHPWFADVKAFINLEGTGAAPGTRAMAFRTNSWEVLQKYSDGAPFPYASSVVESVVSSIASDTDYRPYTTHGRLPGVDIAFFSDRALYHTKYDDMNHSYAISAQHMGDNTLGTILAISNSKLLETIKPAPVIEDVTGPLPVSGFLYYDILGSSLIMTKQRALISGMALLVFAVFLGTTLKATTEILRRGLRRVTSLFIRPMVEANILIWTTLGVTIAFVSILSKIKSLINPGSTYGLPGLNIAWIVPAVLAAALVWQSIWRRIALRLKLRKRSAGTYYHVLPATTLDEDEDSDAESELSTENLSTGPTVDTWLAYGLLGFWWLLLLVNLTLAAAGLASAYVLYDFAFFSAVSVTVAQLASIFVRKWWRAETSDSPPAVWKERVVELYEQHAWAVELVIGNTMPAILVFDIADTMYWAIPSLIAEGLAELSVDLTFAILTLLVSLNLLPAMNLVNRPALAFFFIALALPSYLGSAFIFPFNPDRPHKLSMTETWDVSNTTVAASSSVSLEVMTTLSVDRWQRLTNADKMMGSSPVCEAGDRADRAPCVYSNVTPPPNVVDGTGKPVSDPTSLIDVALLAGANDDGIFKGSFTGVPNSRVCTLDVTYPLMKNDTLLGLWIDPNRNWSSPDATFPTPGKPTPGRDYTAGAIVLRRAFENVDRRMRAEFAFTADPILWGAPGSAITVGCWLGPEVSPTFERLDGGELPDWQTFVHTSHGTVIVKKTVHFDG